ncbi:MAG: glycosyltransferase [Eubacteriales bacterium]|nr:glycosyltransferase [Eubacteriales bacterium]
MKKSLATVVMPVYQAEKYIIEMLNSIIMQTYRPIELIISDDHSTDNTLTIIEEWHSGKENTDFYVKVNVRDKNVGLCINISDAMSWATGEFILLADHDDIWDSRKIEEQVSFLQVHPECSAVLCNRRLIDMKGKTLLESEYAYIKFDKTRAGFEDLLHKRCRYSANTLAFRNSGLESLLPLPEGIMEPDYFITLRQSLMGELAYLHEPLVNYRIHNNSITRNYFPETSRGIRDFYKCSMASTKRVKNIINIDGPAVLGELQKRFGVTVDSSWYHTVFVANRYKRFLYTLLYYKKNKIFGAFIEK